MLLYVVNKMRTLVCKTLILMFFKFSLKVYRLVRPIHVKQTIKDLVVQLHSFKNVRSLVFNVICRSNLNCGVHIKF